MTIAFKNGEGGKDDKLLNYSGLNRLNRIKVSEPWQLIIQPTNQSTQNDLRKHHRFSGMIAAEQVCLLFCRVKRLICDQQKGNKAREKRRNLK